MQKILLNSYHPLCGTKYGRKSIIQHSLPSYVDGSIRREPDFESQYPSITGLCRGPKCAPRLFSGDRIVYSTVMGSYASIQQSHWRIVGILEVIKRFDSHEDAARWYRGQGLRIPSNCLIEDNPPLPIEQSIGLGDKRMKRIENLPPKQKASLLERMQIEWDEEYKEKVRKWPVFIVTTPLCLELREPPAILRDDLLDIFGRIPGTRTPCEISDDQLDSLIRLFHRNRLKQNTHANRTATQK